VNPPAFTGVEPSQPSVQKLVPTLKAGSLAVLASRTTIGKTAWAVDLARHALTQQVPVLYCSGREPKHDIGIRFLAGVVGIDNTDLIIGQISPQVSQRLNSVRDMFTDLPLDVLVHPRDMVGELQERLASGPRGLVVIDDIDALIDPTELHKNGAEPTAQQLTRLASDRQVSVLALTQLDRVPDAEYGRPPQWTDLGVRRPLADHAETVILLHRADYYDPKDRPGQLQVQVVKSASGQTGEVALTAHLPTSVFTDLAEPSAAPEEDESPIRLEWHTHDPEEQALLRAYWALDEDGQSWRQTVTQVRGDHGLTSTEMTRIVRSGATAWAPGAACLECGELYSVAHRTEYAELLRHGARECRVCQAAARAAELQAAQERQVSRRTQVLERFPVIYQERPPVQELSLFQAVGLHTLFSDPAVEDAGLTTPTHGWPKERPWAPTNLRVEYERRLIRAEPATIHTHPDSHEDAFVWEDGALTGKFYLGAISYHLIGAELDLAKRAPAMLQELNLTFREGPWPTPWLEQWQSLWEELTLSYAATYLDMKLGEHHLEMKQGEGTRTALADALATFSLGQVFNFIYRATKDSAAYYQRGGVTKRQAANSTVGRLSGSADRARANGWETKSFGRPWNLPLSAFGEVFFSKVMWQPEMMDLTVKDVRPPKHALTQEPAEHNEDE
jgi:hypothetical protein